MDLIKLFANKDLKPKQKTEMVSNWLTENSNNAHQLIVFAKTSKDPVKASCVEALEFASKINPALSTEIWMDFAIEALAAKAPRIKWEAAKVIGNIAHLHPQKINVAIIHLLENASHQGTVVRWSAAYALGQIVMMKNKINKTLLPAIETICNAEEKNSIKKIYQLAIKKLGSQI